MLHPTRPVVLPFLLVVLAVASSARSAENAPFLTTAKLINPKEVENGKVEVWVAEKKKIAYAWSNSVFAVHVPFQLETTLWTRGEVAKDIGKAYEVTATASGFAYRDPRTGEEAPPPLEIVNVGYYRFDSAFERHLKGRMSHAIPARPGRGGLRWQLLNNWSLQRPGPAGVWLAIRTDAGRYDKNKGTFPAWETYGAEVQGTLHVTLRKKEKDDTGIAAKVDVPLRIRQNGWLVQQAKATLAGAWGKPVRRRRDHDWTVHDAGTTCQPGRVLAAWRTIGTPRHAGVQRLDSTVTLDVQFTPTLWDIGVTNASYTFAQTAGGKGDEEYPFFVSDCRFYLFGYPPGKDGKPHTGDYWTQTLYASAAEDLKTTDPKGRYAETRKFRNKQAMREGDGLRVGLVSSEWRGGKVGTHHMGRIELTLFGGLKKTVDFYGMRLSEIQDSRVGTVETVETPTIKEYDDGYMAWLPKHGVVVRENLSRINGIRARLQALKVKAEKADLRFRHLLRMTQQSFQWRDPQAGDDFIEQVFSGMRNPNLRYETLTPETLRMLKNGREKVTADITATRSQQRKLIAEAEACMKAIVASMEAQVRRSKGRRKKVAADAQRWSDQSRTLAADLYFLAGLWEEMHTALSRYDYGSNAVQEVIRLRTAQREQGLAKLAERKLWLQSLSGPVAPTAPIVSTARQHEVNAWKALRDVLAINPLNFEAQAMLQESELRFLNTIGRKLARERRLAYEGFRTYLVERGYDPDGQDGWWDGIKERAYAAWATGPVGTVSGFLGKPQDMAERASTIQVQAATCQVALMIITRLRSAGMSMAEIRKVTPEQIVERMNPRTTGNGMLDDLKVRRMATDVRETFNDLYDLQAMADGDPQKLATHLVRSYYRPEDVGSTWPEYIGDLFSARHMLFLLGPSAVTRVGGRWQVTGNPFGTWRTTRLRALNVGGSVETGHDLLAATLQIERLTAAFSSTKLGGWFARAVQADMAYRRELGALARFGTGVTRFASAFVLYGGVHHFADENNLPALKTFVDAVALLGIGEMATQAMHRAGVVPRAALRKIGTFESIIQRERQMLARDQEALATLRNVNQKLKSRSRGTPAGADTKALSAADVERVNAIGKRSQTKATRPVDGTNARADTGKAIETASAALRNGDTEAATRAIKAAEDITQARAAGIRKAAAKATQARKNVEAMLREPPAKLKKFEQEHPPMRDPTPEQFIPKKLVRRGRREEAVPRYNEFIFGPDLQRGDLAFRRNDFALARKHYREARALCSGDDKMLKALDRRINLARNAQAAGKVVQGMRAKTKRLAAGNAIGEKELQRVVEQVNAGTLRLEYHAGSANPVFFVRDPALGADAAPRFVFKINKRKQAGELLGGNPDELVAEELGAVLAQQLGIRAPGTRQATMTIGRIEHGGEIYQGVQQGLLMRYLPGKELHQIGEDIIVATKADYARIRVLRAWLGDYDVHLRNLMLGTDGRLYMIDAGYACWRKTGTPMHILSQNSVRTEEQLVDFAVSLPALYSKVKRGTAEAKDYALYHWIDRIDDMVHYDDMAPTVEAIRKLCGNRKALRDHLRSVIGKRNPATGAWEPDERQVAETLQMFIERSQHLPKILQKRFSRLDLRRLPGRPAPAASMAA